MCKGTGSPDEIYLPAAWESGSHAPSGWTTPRTGFPALPTPGARDADTERAVPLKPPSWVLESYSQPTSS